MDQISFFPFNNPSNIYGLTTTYGDRPRILVATLEKQVFSIEYSENGKFTCNEVHFAYIPNGADIISIDSFSRSNSNDDIVVGITFFKNYKESDSNEFRNKNVVHNNSIINNHHRSSSTNILEKNTGNHYYFNIYSSLSCDLNQIAQECQFFELDFVPYHLYHTCIINEDNLPETLWLLSGSDCFVHVFREGNKKSGFYKEKIDLFPELNNYESIVLWMDVFNYKENNELRRLSASGCENGNVHLFFVELEDPTNPRIIKSWKNRLDGPLISVKFFKDSTMKSPLVQKFEFFNNENDNNSVQNINLLVINGQNPTIYRNVQENGLMTRKILPQKEPVDLFLSSFIGDLNFDSYNEILLGSYRKKIWFYKYDENQKNYSIIETMKVSYPVLGITYLDLTGDGVNELVIVTTRGIIIYKHKFDIIIKILKEKIEKCLVVANSS